MISSRFVEFVELIVNCCFRAIARYLLSFILGGRNQPSVKTLAGCRGFDSLPACARSFYRESSFIRRYFIPSIFHTYVQHIYTLHTHALRVCRIVFDNVQFDSVLYTFVFARRYIENTISSVRLSFTIETH